MGSKLLFIPGYSRLSTILILQLPQTPKKYTQEVIAGLLGVARSTVEIWFLKDISNDKDVNTNTPAATRVPDARVTIPKKEHSMKSKVGANAPLPGARPFWCALDKTRISAPSPYST